MVVAELLKRAVGRSALAHIVFRMNLKESVVIPFGHDRLQVLVLETRSG
jgi:hypothetical protein